ncbi:MAG: urease accessory protein UreD, partial [Rhabdochlamydiaceae bacterium]
IDTEATKLYKMESNYASRRVDVFLGQNACLEMLSKETIAYKKSRWYQRTNFHVSRESRFLYSDIFCPGRIAMGEFWELEVFASKFSILDENERGRDSLRILTDNVIFKGSDKENVDVIFGGKKFLLSAYWYSGNASEASNSIKERMQDGEIYGGLSSMPDHKGIVVKALSNDLERLKELQLSIWSCFRMVEFGTKAPDLRMY